MVPDRLSAKGHGMRFKFTRQMAIVATTFLAVASLVTGFGFALHGTSPQAHAAPTTRMKPFCMTRPQLCTETAEPWNSQGQYTGHDEPSLLFYSTVPGSGNSSVYNLTLPTDPANAPMQDGSGGVANYMQHPAFWFGMIMCDNQDAPNPGVACNADTDQNIFHSPDPHSPNYFGLTPGQAYMEMQFYAPGWGNVGSGVSCGPDNTQWCAAMTIDSVQSNSNTGQPNNDTCNGLVGPEPVNYAIITKSGHPNAPADPLRQTLGTFETTSDTLEMNSGDQITTDMHDTPAGFQVVITDHTTGQTGTMTASIANGFGHALFQPTAMGCTDQPYAYHPMFSTSTPSTRNYWAAHSYNVAFSDEIGHFEYCSDTTGFACNDATNPTDPSGADGDEFPCFTLPQTEYGNAPLGGCLGQDLDFDGPEYARTWPGSPGFPAADQAAPVTFSSPLFYGPGNSGLRNYQQAAFENDLPRIELFSCQRHVSNPADAHPGSGCVDPPPGASWYPIFSTATVNGQCVWEEGDVGVPNATDNFGGTPTAEYGGLQLLSYPATGFTITQRYNDFNNTLSTNPCLNSGGK
jgi:hypothetical protein